MKRAQPTSEGYREIKDWKLSIDAAREYWVDHPAAKLELDEYSEMLGEGEDDLSDDPGYDVDADR